MEAGPGRSPEARALSALLFLQGGMVVLDAYSTLNSSPWTAESFGGDPAKVKSLREYVTHAAIYSTAYNVASASIAGSPWPLYAAVVNNVYLIYLYKRAAARGDKTGAQGWNSGNDTSVKAAQWGRPAWA